MDNGRHLEHVHAYYGPSNGEALEAHVDEGVMVAMVARDGGSLRITLPGGASHELRWDAENAVLILAGDSSRYLGNRGRRRTELSLALSDNEARPWYGLMVLPPDDALLDGERFDKRRERRTSTITIGLSRSLTAVDPAATCQTQDGKDGIFCWLQCLEVDCAYGAVCLDKDDQVVPKTRIAKGIVSTTAARVCRSQWCPLQQFKIERRRFCRGSGQDMHMDGFRSAFEDSTPPCINLYVADWTLSSVGKYVGGMFGAFFVGLLVECTSFCGSTCTEGGATCPGPGWA